MTTTTFSACLIAITGCVTDEVEFNFGHERQAAILPNAILPNAILPNAILPNAILPNAILPNGASTIDYTFNGFSFNPASPAGLSIAGQGIDAVSIAGLIVNGTGANAVTVNGQALSVDQESAFELLATYLVNCALPAGEATTITASTGESKHYEGAMGLAPEWATGALSDAGKRYVSACIAARSNANGQRVLLSLRGGNIAVSATENTTFGHAEGAFFGDVFGDAPSMSSCAALGGGLAGRDCTDGACYFTDAGECAAVCATQNADGSFSDCAGHAAVITTYLPTTVRESFAGSHNCSTDAAGTLNCWGKNKKGQLGNGTTQNVAAGNGTTVDFGDNVAVVEIASGKKHSCARKADGKVRCWGENKAGQAGIGSSQHKVLAPSTDDALITDAMSLRSGADHACALEADGTVLCWGKNKSGQLGDSSTDNSDVPVVVDLGTEVISIAAGNNSNHSCAITLAGNLACWGKNKRGQLGDDSDDNRSTPVLVEGLSNVTDACTGERFTCALDALGEVFCFGKINNSETPVQVALAQSATAVSCTKNAACATLADGSEQCW